MEDLETRFASRGVKRGGLLLFRPAEALAFIDEARAERTPVLGIETFTLTEQTTQSHLDHILDLSDAEETFDTWSRAAEFVSERADGDYFFEVTV
jgi:hypothetical protein